MIFGISKNDLSAQESLHTAVEITQQPHTLAAQYQALSDNEPVINRFLSAVYAHGAYRIMLSGAGSSAYAGHMVAQGIRTAHQQVMAVPTTSITANPSFFLQDDRPVLMVHFARSGNSPESLATAEWADRLLTTVYHLVITCNPEGKLANAYREKPNALVLQMPPETNDNGFAMTSSVTAMLLTGYITLSRRPYGDFAQDVAYITQCGTQFFEAEMPALRALAEKPLERFVFLGGEPLEAVCREAALKLLELTDGRVATLFETPMGFRHGPKTFVNNKTFTLLMLSNQPYPAQYEQDLLRELASDGRGNTLAVLANKPGAADGADYVFTLPTAGTLQNDFMVTFIYLFFAQRFAFTKSYTLGIHVDSPCADGTASRVVKGVVIHPLEEQKNQ